MAGYKYFTVLTDVGKQKLVEAISSETPLDFTEIAIGDANGVSYDPTGSETALKHEVFKKAIDSVSIDSIDKNIMIFEMVVPASSGGYYMREAGLFSSDGSLIAIARIAEQYKPLLSEGAGASITISMRIAVSSEAQVYINIPESINYATHNYVKEEFEKHITNSNPHEQYVILNVYNETIRELEDNIDSKAASNHNHDGTYSKTNHTHTGYAVSNHNHDGTYSKTNHTHTGYAASSHSHAFSAITGSMDLTDNRLKGLLPISKGGTNSQDGFGWKNTYSDAEFNAKIGLNYPFTTQQLVDAIINLRQPLFCMVYGWRKGQSFITDFPSSDLSHRTIINYIDSNQFYIETIDPFNLTTYICYVSGGVAGKWIKTRNDDGSIPADLIPPTVLKYENSDGVWTETKLTTGEVMLEGGKEKVFMTNEQLNIKIPKTIKTVITAQVSGSTYDGASNAFISAGSTRISIVGPLNRRINWYFKGIIQQ